MKYIDMHADTVLHLLQNGEDTSLYDNNITHVDLKKLQAGDNLAQSFAVWMVDDNFDSFAIDSSLVSTNPQEDKVYIERAVNRLNKEITNHKDIISWVNNSSEIEQNNSDGKLSAILTLEDARVIDNSLENIDWLKDTGFQMIGLLWNNENSIGFPNSFNPEENERGLKEFGKKAVEYIEYLNMLVDVSHLNDGGISDVLALAEKPVIASHSNARQITSHSRNLSDHHIRGIADSGGIVGLVFAPHFVNSSEESLSTIDHMIRHLDHLVEVGGEDILAIGTDFDGITGDLEIDSPAKMPVLFERLEDHGWSNNRIEKLAYKNFMRVFQ